jgi:hypothetical protein
MVESSERLPLPEVIHTSGKGLRPKVRTVTEAIHLIDEELSIELSEEMDVCARAPGSYLGSRGRNVI